MSPGASTASRGPAGSSSKPPAKGVNEGFPEPSPIEIVVSSSEHDVVALPARKRKDAEPLIPIVLDDDDDEVIDLD